MDSSLGFYIGGRFFAYYGTMIVLGLAAGSVIGYIQLKRQGKDFNDFILLASIGGLFGIIGAKILYLAVSWENIDFSRLGEPAYLSALMSGGFVFYGGLIGGFAGLFVCKKCLHIDVISYLNCAIACLPAVHGFGRIGCSLAGCCYGIPYTGPGAVIYEHSLIAPEGVSLFPVQLTEACLDFVIAALLLILSKKLTGTKGIQLYIVFYAAARFILEFFRYDAAERGVFGGISTSQYISLLLLAAVLGWHFLERRIQKPE